MVTKVISELKSISTCSRLKILSETGPRCLTFLTYIVFSDLCGSPRWLGTGLMHVLIVRGACCESSVHIVLCFYSIWRAQVYGDDHFSCSKVK